MTTRKQNALASMAARGTAPERAVAQKKLGTGLAVRSEEQDDVWTGQGVLARQRGNNRAYLRGIALQHFLGHVRDGVPFTARSISMNDDFGSGDFYMVLSWLLKNDLCIKNGTRYTVPNRAFVKATWNAAVDAMKL